MFSPQRWKKVTITIGIKNHTKTRIGISIGIKITMATKRSVSQSLTEIKDHEEPEEPEDQ